MKFYVGSDHAGFRTKEALKEMLAGKGIEAVDVGTFSDDSVDYPDFAFSVAKRVAEDRGSYGLLVCGTGIGMCIAANKVRGVRAANPFDSYTARVAREHNNVNVICLGGRTYKAPVAKRILGSFLAARPGREKRHVRRLGKIARMEDEGK